jgi:hypothetical protein
MAAAILIRIAAEIQHENSVSQNFASNKIQLKSGKISKFNYIGCVYNNIFSNPKNGGRINISSHSRQAFLSAL